MFLGRGNTNFFNASFLILGVYTQFSLNLKRFYSYDDLKTILQLVKLKLRLYLDDLQLKAFLRCRRILKVAFISVPRPRVSWNQRHTLKVCRVSFKEDL